MVQAPGKSAYTEEKICTFIGAKVRIKFDQNLEYFTNFATEFLACLQNFRPSESAFVFLGCIILLRKMKLILEQRLQIQVGEKHFEINFPDQAKEQIIQQAKSVSALMNQNWPQNIEEMKKNNSNDLLCKLLIE